jgi:hypothetical protein
MKELARMATEYPEERLEYAFSEAGKAGADLRYVAKVLENKKEEGKKQDYDHSDDHIYIAALKREGINV